MSDYSAAMTAARMQLVQLRLQGSILAMLVQRGLLRSEWAAAAVREAGAHLASPTNDPDIEPMFQQSLQQLERDLGRTLPQEPFQG